MNCNFFYIKYENSYSYDDSDCYYYHSEVTDNVIFHGAFLAHNAEQVWELLNEKFCMDDCEFMSKINFMNHLCEIDCDFHYKSQPKVLDLKIVQTSFYSNTLGQCTSEFFEYKNKSNKRKLYRKQSETRCYDTYWKAEEKALMYLDKLLV